MAGEEGVLPLQAEGTDRVLDGVDVDLDASLVSPGRVPASRSASRTHVRSVSGVQPIFLAMEEVAAHRDG